MKIAQLIKLRNLSVYSILFLLIVPSIIWAALDQRVWPWDQAWYAQVSVELFYRLTHSPLEWFKDMVAAFGIKAPALSWFGQLFVPVGQFIGSIEVGLLLSIVLTQFIVLLIIFHIVLDLTSSRLISLVCSLFASSAPLSVALSHQYLVEPLQTASVAWTMLIMVFSPQWKPRRILFHLVSAISLGMLAKVTYPLYAFGPIITIVYYIFNKSFKERTLDKLSQKKVNIFSAISPLYISTIILSSSFLLWYGKNFPAILSFSIQASSGEASLLYGEKAHFLYKLYYWLGAFQKSFFAPITMFLIMGVLILALAKSFYDFKKSNNSNNSVEFGYFDVVTVVSLSQIMLVIACFSFQVNQENRYLLPLLPYLCLVISWALKKVRQRLLTICVGFVIIFQLIIVQSQALGFTSVSPELSYWLYPFDRNTIEKRTLSGLVDATCGNKVEENRYNVIGLELPWFNANSATYFSSKHLLDRDFRCYYTSLGYAENDVEKAWQRLFDINVNYFATLQLRSQVEATNPLNLVSLPILERIQGSTKFTREVFFYDQSRVLLYKKINL